MVDLQVLGPDSDLGHYRLVRLLGRGGMGEVYLAHDQSLDRDVAIKFISPEKTADEDARRRLMREARAAAALDHPAICTVLETGETASGRTYIVMQFVEGEPLSTVLEKRRLSVRDALLICAQVAEGLDVAHRHGVVHRDLKPANVMLTPSGHPKLVDFGIAKVALATSAIPESTTTSVSTTAGVIIGTPAYMSPEQAQQGSIDGRSDLFSLGAVLFECLTGRRAFEGATSLETIGAVLHVHPPPPSRIRPQLDERHDELCRRLLAKDPADRFQSAQEVVGAIRLLVPDTSRAQVPPVPDPGKRRPAARRRWAIAAIVTAVLAIVAATAWFSSRPGLPPAPAEAERWYRLGTEALREGAYYKATKSLQSAVQLFPSYTLAYARLAEAGAELDDYRLASDSLLRVAAPANLDKTERLRLSAVTSLVRRDVDQAIAAYSELARLNPKDAGAWLDLGRAQEAASLPDDARASYERAIAADRQYAPGYVRLGSVEGLNSRRDEALAAFAEAERLYETAVDVEGLTEVLLRRGAMLDSFGEAKPARADLERALSMATDVNAPYQQVRARLLLSSVTATEGHLEDAQRAASSAVQDALSQRLDTIAAEGLLDLASVMQSDHLPEAEAHAQRAVQLADHVGASRTAARGRLQLAAIHEEQGQPRKALDVLTGVLPFLKEKRYRRFELQGLSIAVRAHQRLDDLDEAQRISTSVLEVSETLKNGAQVALAVSNLASVTMALGNYPEALRLRQRAEEIHKRQGDADIIPYDLVNRADLLIRLGRAREADPALVELEAGMRANVDSYVGRERRGVLMRAFSAVTSLRCDEALPLLQKLQSGKPQDDSPAVMGPALTSYCAARVGRRYESPAGPAGLDPTVARERIYWTAAAALQRSDWQSAYSQASAGLKLLGNRSNDELRWRLATISAIAARRLGNESIVAGLISTARTALDRVEAQWQGDFASYRERPDLADLIRRGDQK
jgi:tetratricopeptide (TPR) repeat protein/predicted Ser/Thr protein kinase